MKASTQFVSFLIFASIVLSTPLLAADIQSKNKNISETGISQANKACSTWLAVTIAIKGKVELRRDQRWQAVKKGDTFCQGDVLRVRAHSRAVIRMKNEQTNLTLDQHSSITFTGKNKDKNSSVVLDFLKGVVHIISRVPHSLGVSTPYVNAAIEGTEFVVSVDDVQTQVSVFEGKVSLTNDSGQLLLNSGQTAITKANQAPELKVAINPIDAVQWALYYPPIIRYSESDFTSSDNELSNAVKQAITKHRAGQTGEAFQILQAIDKDTSEPQFYVLRASLAIAVGSIASAQQDLSKSVQLQSNNSDAMALQSIIAITQNKNSQALEIAKQAIAQKDISNAQKATAQLSLSYAYQANYQLDAALQSAKRATQSDSKNGFAWTRLSEVQLMHGDVKKSVGAANKAIQIAGNFSRNHAVLGFAYLNQLKTTKAQRSFEKAVELDENAPLPRFGLGLSLIKQGKLEPGREQLEIATSLDSRNSLLRSYVGKAYFEEGRNDKAAQQFFMAKQLDPKDPTPYLYDAILKQSEFRSAEALQELQSSTELNDNKIVFRSRMLLDQDNAVKNISKAAIYQSLGFNQLALTAARKAERSDPTNFASHKMLAESYLNVPRYEFARASEYFQAQLLQPVMLSIPQAELQETGLFVLKGAGISSIGFNEFNSVFNSDGALLRYNNIFGGNDLHSANVGVSFKDGNSVFSVSQFAYSSDGFRANNDINHTISGLSAQFSLTNNTNLQFELRNKDTEYGDLKFKFDLTDFSATERTTDSDKLVRLSLSSRLDSHSHFLMSALYNESEFSEIANVVDVSVEPDSTNIGSASNSNVELQYLSKIDDVNLKAGVSAISINGDESLTLRVFAPFPPTFDLTLPTKFIRRDIEHNSAYGYADIEPYKNLNLTLGLVYDHYESNMLNIKKISPKVGMMYDIAKGTSVRATAFRHVKQPLLNNRTIQPVHIAGFNQLYDDANGAKVEQFGLAFDKKITANLYTGLEVNKRKLNIVIENLTDEPPTVKNQDQNERLYNAYLYWVMNKNITLSTEYFYEKAELFLDQPDINQPLRLSSHRAPISLTVNSNGVRGKLIVTYANQEYVALKNSVRTLSSDKYWLSDLVLDYQFLRGGGLVKFGVKNIFDRDFQHFNVDFQTGIGREPQNIPERQLFMGISINI